MDANGSKFYLLLGFDDWADCVDDGGLPLRNSWLARPPSGASGLHWDLQHFEITLQPLEFNFPASPKDTIPSLADRRGAARDRFDNWYWISQNRVEILVNSIGSGRVSHFWSAGDSASCEREPVAGHFAPVEPTRGALPLTFAGLAITEDNYLVAGTLAPRGLLIFDLYAGAAPRQILWPERVPFEPFDMAPRPGGGVWVLDRVNRRYWGLDRQFGVIRQTQPAEAERIRIDDFQPQDHSAVRRSAAIDFPAGFSLDDPQRASAIDPISIEALPDGTVLILDRNAQALFSQVFRYRLGQRLGAAASMSGMASLIENAEETGFDLIAHDIAFVPASASSDSAGPDRLYVAARTGNQSFVFGLSAQNDSIELDPLTEYLPMRLFGGKGLVRADSQVYYDFGDGWIPLIHQCRPRYKESGVLKTPARPELGTARRPAFDGGEPGCVWHRLMLDARIPAETGVQVWSRASDDESQLAFTEWQQEPGFYLRGDGSEQPFAPMMKGDNNGTWELLLQNARGRFLQLRLALSGTGRATPRIRALRVYYPRFSYLDHYVPAVYRDDVQSASFLDRFLANIEGFYTSLEDEIASVEILFDPSSVPSEALDWLAGWFGMALNAKWDEATRRLFIRHAMDFFQYRGTVHGIRMALRLAFDQCPTEEIFTDLASQSGRGSKIRIIEKFLTRQAPGVLFGDPTDQVGPRVISLNVRWKPSDGRAALNERYRAYLGARGSLDQPFKQFPLNNPGGSEGPLWEQFSRDTLGFVPSASADDLSLWQSFLEARYQDIANLNDAYGTALNSFAEISLPADVPPDGPPGDDWNEFIVETATGAGSVKRALWQDFLSRRYQRVSALNQAYQTVWTSFAAVPIPSLLPPDGPPLVDWHQFESVVMAMQRTAHRFSVLLPASGTGVTAAERRKQLNMAERIVNLEKPAHTVFDVKYYWAFFRIGEARLGQDTVIDLGGRSPQLMTPMKLGEGYLAEAYLAPPYQISDRQVLGRDPLH